MLLVLSDGSQIRGDLIVSAALRYDLAPIPVTLEAQIRTGDDNAMAAKLAQGQTITAGAGELLRIVKSVQSTTRAVQGEHEIATIRLTALLDACHKTAFVRSRAVIKESAALSAIYRACGATLQAVDADFAVPRFYCPVGETPTFHIARALQEEGGAVRWKSKRLQFVRLPSFLQQKPVIDLPSNAADDVESGFLERHEVPWFFSIAPDAGFVFGNQVKPRAVRFAPYKDIQRLRNMTRCLVHRKTLKMDFAGHIVAGDIAAFPGGDKLCIVTAAHVFESGENAGSGNGTGESKTYTRLWLASLEE